MEFYDDDGNLVATGAEATAAWLAHVDRVQEHNRQALAQLRPHELARLETWLRTRTHATPPVRPQSRLSNGRAPREARNNRVRGSKRSRVRRSSERSGDSGSDDGEPPPARECAWCGEPIDHLNADARYCGAKHRVYAQRERDRQLPERVAARAAENGASGRAKPCRCWPQHDLVDRNVCVKCGRARGAVVVAWITEARDLRSRQLVTRAPARRNPRLGDGKRRPPNEFIDESIIGAAAA